MTALEQIGGPLAEREKTLIIESDDDRLTGGFTQVPNVVLKNDKLTFGAKTIYALLLSYAWHNNQVFPGQEALARDAGITRKTVNKYVQELVRKRLVTVKHRGLGRTAIYTLHQVVDKTRR